jgi:hypothetical protein
MTKHVARHRLERLVAAGPNPAAEAATRVHIASCDPCAVRKRAFDRAREEYLRAHPPDAFAQAVMARAQRAEATPARAWRWSRVGALVGLAAAAALGVIALQRRLPDASTDAIRPEGTVSFQVQARSGDRTFALHDGATLAPGDQLAFTYSLTEPRHLLLLGVDDAGTVTRYFPPAGESGRPLGKTDGAQLPVGVELDARRGRERMFALFSQAPFDESAVRLAIARALARAQAGGAGIEALPELDVDAEQVRVWFQKPDAQQ